MILVAAFALLISSTSVARCQSAYQRAVNQGLDVDRCELQLVEFDVDTELGTVTTKVDLPYLGRRTLELHKHTVRSDIFEVLVDDGSGVLKRVPAPSIKTYRGSVVGDPSLRVSATFDGVAMRAIVRGVDDTWGIQPVSDAGQTGREHAAYHVADNTPLDVTCGVVSSSPGSVSAGPAPMGTGLEVCQLAIDADYYYYNDIGSVAGVVNDIEALLNAIDDVYNEPNVDIIYEITTMIVRTTSGTYTTSAAGSLLDQVQANWNNPPESAILRDVAHMFTGRNLDGTTIGIAQFAKVCNLNQAYGLSQSRYTSNWSKRVSLTSHELGHNWSASHCDSQTDCRIMCSVNGSCDGLSPLTFAPGPVSQIANYRNGASCLREYPLVQSIPFEESFPLSSLSTERWQYNDGASTTTSASGTPSSPYVMVLNAATSGDYQDDEVRTSRIALAGTSNPTLQFYLSRSSVPAGGELWVEYLNSSLDWVQVDHFVSDGVNPSSFSLQSYDLPFNSRHNGFRLRFRVDVDSSSQRWFIDDVYVGDGPPMTLGPPTISYLSPSNGPVAGGTSVTVHGTNFDPAGTVLFGFNPLVSQQFIDSTEIHGFAPAATGPSIADVFVSQASGMALLPAGYTYSDNQVGLTSTPAGPGSIVDSPVFASHDTTLAGFSLAVDFVDTYVNIVELSLDGADGPDPDFFVPTLNNDPEPGSWWTVGVVYDISPPIEDHLPPGDNQVLLTARFEVESFAPVGTLIQLYPQSGVGQPPVDLVFTLEGGISVQPESYAGLIQVVASTFIRADANGDGSLDIADPISMLAVLFDGAATDCADAIDANDDGANDIADPIYALGFLFDDGPDPPAPFPNPGSDPTPDALGCD